MTVAQGGDSSISEAFGFGGAGDAIEEETNAQAADVLQEEEGTQDNTADGAADDASKEAEPEKTESPQEDKAEKHRMEEAHRLIIDTIEDELTKLHRGEISPHELKEWFTKNPEFADIANRSKRVKDTYRRFVDTKIETPVTQQKEEKRDENEDDNRPLTVKDWKALQREVQDETLKQQYARQNKSTFESYAQQYDLKDEAAGKLKSVADSLFQANSDWTYEEAIKASHRALYDGKGSPVGIPSGNNRQVEQKNASGEEKVDLSQWNDVVSFEDFTSRKS